MSEGPESRTFRPLPVVIVHWNQPDACLATLDEFLGSPWVGRVTLIDNGSTDAALAALRAGLADRPEVEADVDIVEVGCNIGFGPAANVGLRRFLGRAGDGPWVVLAPHDVELSWHEWYPGEPAEATLPQMAIAAEAQPMAGLCCADVGDGMVPVIDPYFGGMTVPADPAELPVEPPPGESAGARWESVDYPHGTLMLLRRECLAEIGLFDERYFSYCEEADLALRARRAGWDVGLVRGARVHNVGLGSSVWLVDYLQTRNTLLLVQEMSGWYHAAVRICFTLIQVLRGVVRPGARPPVFDAHARLAGVRDFILRRFGPPPARRSR